MDRGLSNRSIIQSTLFNISITVFVLSIILIALFGQSFWEKEAVKLDYKLLNTAITVKDRVEWYYYGARVSNDNFSGTSKEEAIQRLNLELKPLLGEHEPYCVAYYDLNSQYLVSKQGNIGFDINEILNQLYDNQEIQLFNQNDYSLVSIPVTQGGTLLGYVWAYAAYPEIRQSFSNVHLFFIMIFALLGTIILLIRKYMKNIHTELEEFAESIVHHELPMHDSQRLPELKPVFEKIMVYTQELNRINEELESSQRKINQIMEGITDGIFAIDKEWRLLFYNDVSRKHFNKSDEELYMTNLFEILPGLSHRLTYRRIMEARDISQPVYFEEEGIMAPGRYFALSVYPFEEGVTIFYRDITELRQQQNEMARLERLNLVGQMAAGISHEIRNPLTTVKGFLQLRGSKVNDPEEREYNELMISEIDRANTIISEFLSLAKHNVNLTKEQDINQIIYRIFPIIQADANNSGKELILNLNPLPSLLLNENEIRQLILNLVRNALEVTPQGGCVIIRTYKERNNIVLAVQDQGSGIPEEIRDKIGTPFFTTKESGTGLGIAISMGIARRHNAELDFVTGNDGTTFRVIFRG